MDSKKPSSSMLRHLRQKMAPRFWRGKSAKLPLELDPSLDYRMSSSVPDMRDMKQAFPQGPSRARPLQAAFPSYSSPCSPLAKPPGRATVGGRSLKPTPTGQVPGRSEHRLSAPSDCPDWASSQDSVDGRRDRSPGPGPRIPASMEPVEPVQPETAPPVPDAPPQELPQDAPQVHKFALMADVGCVDSG